MLSIVLKQIFSFVLHLHGFSELTEEIQNAVFEAGCDDALLSVIDGQPCLEFDRESESFEMAISQAIEQVESVGRGIRVAKVAAIGERAIQEANAYLLMQQSGQKWRELFRK